MLAGCGVNEKIKSRFLFLLITSNLVNQKFTLSVLVLSEDDYVDIPLEMIKAYNLPT